MILNNHPINSVSFFTISSKNVIQLLQYQFLKNPVICLQPFFYFNNCSKSGFVYV